MLEFPTPERAIKLRAEHVLHDRAVFLSLLGLLKNVPNDKTQTARHV